MKKVLFICLLSFISLSTQAQTTEEDLVKAAVNKLFTAMKESDSAVLIQCFTDSAILQTIVYKYKSEESPVVRTESIKNFAESISKLPKGAADERIQIDVIRINGSLLASVWAPYQFYFKDKFSHCGVNSFQLVKMKGGWKIQYIIDTRYYKATPVANCGLMQN